MGKSYKKTPLAKDKTCKILKRYANKVVKYKDDVPSGMAYKKVFQSYEICDFVFYFTYRRYLEMEGLEDNKYSYAKWYKQYKRK